MLNVHKYVCSVCVCKILCTINHRAAETDWNLHCISRLLYNDVHTEVLFLVVIDSIMSVLCLNYIF